MQEQKATDQWRSIQFKMGVRKGVSDLFFPAGNANFKGLWLELKAEKGKLSHDQLKFMSDMIEEGYAAYVSHGYDEAELIIKKFYAL